MRKIALVLFIFFVSGFVSGQKMSAYQIYSSKGKKVKFKKLTKSIKEIEYVFFGEYHDNPISHWLQYEVMAIMHSAYSNNLVMSFEMFEQDQQSLMDSLINKVISFKEYEEKARLWPNYKTDYKPLLEFAVENSLNCIASNIPRRYASIMFKYGRDSLNQLSDLEKSWICPLDFEIDSTLSQYISIGEMAVHMEGMSGQDLMQAQAIKDATMAYFMLKKRREDDVVLHMNGAFHTDFHQGIIWYIQKADPNAEIITISTVAQSDISKLESENLGRADYIICVPETMTSTH